MVEQRREEEQVGYQEMGGGCGCVGVYVESTCPRRGGDTSMITHNSENDLNIHFPASLNACFLPF